MMYGAFNHVISDIELLHGMAAVEAEVRILLTLVHLRSSLMVPNVLCPQENKD